MTELIRRKIVGDAWETVVDSGGGSLPAGFEVDDNATLTQTPPDQTGDSPFLNLVYDPAELVNISNRGLVMNVREEGTNPGDNDNLFQLGVNIFRYLAALGEGNTSLAISGVDPGIGAFIFTSSASAGSANVTLTDGNDASKSIQIQTGGTGVDNKIVFPALPTDDPLVLGQLWNDGGAVMVSAGPP